MRNKLINDRSKLALIINHLKSLKKTIVFTNGCFDILHAGHVRYLDQAKQSGDVLIVAVNSDQSVKRLKGNDRPINPESDRAAVLAGLESVDLLIIFNEDTPINIIKIVQPDIYIKGGDYTRDTLPETPYVEKYGGKVVIYPLIQNKSTTNIINKIKGDKQVNKPKYKSRFLMK